MAVRNTANGSGTGSVRILLAIAAAACSPLAFAYGWSQYGPGSAVELPAGDAEVTDADYDTVAALGSVLLSDSSSRIVFNLSDDHSAKPLGCSITGAGTIVKDGEGTLQFGAPHSTSFIKNVGWFDYFTTNGIALNAGTLKFPQGGGAGCRFSHVTMAANTTLYTANDGESIVESLNGYGLVTNTATARQFLRIGNSPDTTAKSTFYGKIAGEFMAVRVDGYAELMNTENTFNSYFWILLNSTGSRTVRGTAAVAKLGKAGEASSIGTASSMEIRYGGTLRYLGTGEECDRTLTMYANSRYANIIDGGDNGGLVWSGRLHGQFAADGKLVFTGDNASDCVWSGPWSFAVDGGWTWYFAKEGSGTWRMAGNAERLNPGAWAVREGTLKFDSLAEKGDVCSLGLATELYSDAYCTDKSKRVAVDYAILLGSEGQYPTLEYSGSGTGASTNRPVRLAGTGGTIANSTVTGTVSINGIAAEDAGAKKLTLSGTNTTGNIAGNISDGAGKVSVEKTGSGVWRLEGNQTFSGSLDVKEGTLVVAEKPSQYGYEYYKFSCEQVQNSSQYFAVRRIALYDKDGNRVGVGLSDDPPIADEMDGSWITKWHFNGELQPGYARWDMPSQFYKYTSGEKAATALAENNSQARACMYANFTPAKPGYWPSIVWRLPKEEITPVTHVDIVQEVPVNSYRVGIFTLYGSSDGKAWKALKRVNLMEDETPAGNWVSDGATVTNNAVRPGAGFALDSIGAHSSLPADATYDILTSASGVSVSSGATLKAEGNVALRSLTVDCAAGNGTVDGFDFASNGTINLVNLSSNREVEVPFTLANLPEGALDRLNAEGEWAVTVNGSPRSSWLVSFDGSSAKAVPRGLMMIVK